MSNRIRTQDARTALRTILDEKTREVAGNNTLVSKIEAKNLDPFLKRAEEALRVEGGKGTRVSVDALTERAMGDAMETWNEFNPPGQGLDSALLAKAELAEIRARDPELGALTELAMLRAGKRGQSAAAVVHDYFASFDFANLNLHDESVPGGQRIDARPGLPGRSGVPQEVLQVFDRYYQAEQADWASVSLHRGTVGGHDVYAIYMSTDGDDAYLETFDRQGSALCSARLQAGELMWDEFVGRARLAVPILNLSNAVRTEGYSEPAERAAAGQIPVDWAPEVRVDAATIHHRGSLLGAIDLDPSKLDEEQRQVAFAGLGLAWERVLQHRPDGDADLQIGPRTQGVLEVGSFDNPVDGQHYLVANWKDIDDGSSTFYFQKTDLGLELKIDQYNN
ncbi:MAG: hypothetical protein ABIJ09_09635 [Pseudomonadota bacterium]